jgi:tetratricopeptide (TPR) repeat protein
VRKRIWLTIAILAAGLSALSGARAETSCDEAFVKANQACQEGRFEEAIDGYLHLIHSGKEGGPVYYNLGNAYLKSGQLGRAIWAYERALLLTPRDPDLRFNLSHARDQTRDAIADPRGSIETIFFWLKSFSFNELFGCFAVLNLMFWSLLIIRLFNRSEWLYYLLLIAISLWLIAGLSFGLKYYRVSSDDRAVIVQKETHILAGPDKADTVLFKLHEGTVVHHERSEDGWALIRVSDRNRGWVAARSICRISGAARVSHFGSR